MAKIIGKKIKKMRLAAGYSQADIAKKLKVTQATVSQWESGRSSPSSKYLEKVEQVLGKLNGRDLSSVSVFGAWLRRTRDDHEMSVPELAAKAKVSPLTIYQVESGVVQRPQDATIKAIESALGVSLPKEFSKELKQESIVEGFGEFTDFDPYDEENLPVSGGIYVFYDISDRPVYVGQGENISRRVRQHAEKFWFKAPVVERGSYISISEKKLRQRVETLLIKFLKSNAIINIKNVNREDDES